MTQTILIVEDDRSLRDGLRAKLTHEGYAVLEATNGDEGLQTALKEHPDAILLDMLMPRMDGIATLKALRSDEWGKDAKVLVLSNMDDLTKVSEAVALDAHDYLIKSDHTIEEIVEKIKTKLAASLK